MPCTREQRTETDRSCAPNLDGQKFQTQCGLLLSLRFLITSFSFTQPWKPYMRVWWAPRQSYAWDGEAYGHLMSGSTGFPARLPRPSQVSAIHLPPQTRSWMAPLPGPCSYHTGVSSHLWTCSKLFLKELILSVPWEIILAVHQIRIESHQLSGSFLWVWALVP